MTTTGAQYKLLIQEYDKKRTRALHEKREREEQIYREIPDIEKIDRSLSKIGIHLLKCSLQPNGDELMAAYRQKNEDLVRHKKQLLVEYGYAYDYLDLHHDCPTCQDTGFINDHPSTEENGTMFFSKSTPCKCFQQALIDLAYSQSNLKNVLQRENFNTFRFDVYSDQVNPRFGQSPRDKMRKIYDKAVAFTEYFDTRKENLLFLGPTGLGKTFLCNCIAKEILDKGYSVLYLTAQELFSLFEESRFHRDDMEDESKNALSTLFTVDLLVIDDFGTEVQNSFTAPDLFHVINTRYLNKKSTIISTNLPSKDLQSLYSDRIISRLFGNYDVCRVFGDDIRLLKLRS
ncbi:MAG: ATP-binding protein [Cellulosilyticaceae bacterium]